MAIIVLQYLSEHGIVCEHAYITVRSSYAIANGKAQSWYSIWISQEAYQLQKRALVENEIIQVDATVADLEAAGGILQNKIYPALKVMFPNSVDA
jgi:hypothetical protein